MRKQLQEMRRNLSRAAQHLSLNGYSGLKNVARHSAGSRPSVSVQVFVVTEEFYSTGWEAFTISPAQGCDP